MRKKKYLLVIIIFILVCAILFYEIAQEMAYKNKEKNNYFFEEHKINLEKIRLKNNDSLEFMAALNYTPSSIIPFWFWNGNLTKDEISRQIDLMKKAGIEEVIIHGRSGLVQGYLSEDWFEMIGYALKELKKRDMKAWIYDEFDWPSGRAKGSVLEKNKKLVAKNLKKARINTAELILQKDKFGVREIVSVIYSNVNNNSNVKSKYCNDLRCDFSLDYRNNSIYVFYLDYGKFRTEYTKEFYVDLLNPETADSFLNLTYEEYYKRFSEYFGNTVVGFFTDEPGFYSNTYDRYDVGSIAWTDCFS